MTSPAVSPEPIQDARYATYRELVDLERHLNMQWSSNLSEAIARLETTMANGVTQLTQVMDDRRDTNRWWVGLLITLVGLFNAILTVALTRF